MATIYLRHGVTITGAILLVTGTLCFAWWSDGEMGATTSSSERKIMLHGEAGPVTSSSSSNAVLRSISFFCCGIGGVLLLFGLLWSANAGIVSRHYQYHFSRDLHYSTVEPLEKQTCSTWEASTVPTYEEALNCQPAESAPDYIESNSLKENRPPLYQVVDENNTWHGGRRRSSSDSVLFLNIVPMLESASWDEASIVCDTPPPSYESINLHDG
ncbi:transmembrane protein 61 [Rhineura floridana]|uniref:transmembrane protein 61 n=1 Tax=Rhineura floridana TaxID=261503 RepID=UPI002AC7F38D|nr:transmembrane protein 61 [Rhineura floridana]XP_061489128.1 transmembrane protein 61 [Rhineura floridana]XP_061489129.1 transmembrane protein 61 [Rhineura floridana]XP_061489130.1 transmembrane protein 61 [Rhineura floridana]XP_061489131.1 transmembrane protein 61 [Rhineura floridana]